MKVWVVTARSESGDHYGPYLFAKKPTDEKLEMFIKKKCPNEFDENCPGPGNWKSFIYIDGPKQINVIE